MPLTHADNRGRRKNEKVTPVVCYLESACVLLVAWQEKGPQQLVHTWGFKIGICTEKLCLCRSNPSVLRW